VSLPSRQASDRLTQKKLGTEEKIPRFPSYHKKGEGNDGKNVSRFYDQMPAQ
jgi:hypothetical protein